MKYIRFYITLLASAILCFSCDDGTLSLDQGTASVGFETSRMEVDQANDQQIPLVIRASKGSIYGSYKVYVLVDDPNAWIGNVCTISNPIYKAPNHEEGDHQTIYTATMAEGILKTAILITAGVHSSEDIDRELTFTLLEDPEGASYPNGSRYYSLGGTRSMTLLLKKMEP